MRLKRDTRKRDRFLLSCMTRLSCRVQRTWRSACLSLASPLHEQTNERPSHNKNPLQNLELSKAHQRRRVRPRHRHH
uniref:Uncharacterized protein n=1 Tax=Arundo donax TaxID=35708 RepID=A0A0A9F744_ARUDO